MLHVHFLHLIVYEKEKRKYKFYAQILLSMSNSSIVTHKQVEIFSLDITHTKIEVLELPKVLILRS